MITAKKVRFLPVVEDTETLNKALESLEMDSLGAPISRGFEARWYRIVHQLRRSVAALPISD